MAKRNIPTEFAQIIAQIEQLPCRCCMQRSVKAFVQPRSVPRTRDIVMAHCTNEACALWYVTRAFKDLVVFDLSAWRASEHPDYTAFIDDAQGDTPRADNLRQLVESYIVEREAPVAALVLADFGEQYRAALPHTRRDFCLRWLHIYSDWRI